MPKRTQKKRKIIKPHAVIRHKKKNFFKFKGDSSPLVIMILLIFGIAGLGALAISSSPSQPSAQPTPVLKDNKMSMETFYITPIPTNTPAPTSLPQPSQPPASPNCTNSVTDTMIVLDHSGSMTTDDAITKTKQAASLYVDIVSTNPQSRVGLTMFSQTSDLLNSLTSNFTSVKSNINSINPESNTCIQCGIKTANADIASKKRGITPNIILLTDGKPNVVDGQAVNVIIGPPGAEVTPADATYAKQATLNEAIAGFNASGTKFYTIGFGDVDVALLQEIAGTTGGTAYIQPNSSQLQSIFTTIASQICQ